jgi:hypothetical protein
VLAEMSTVKNSLGKLKEQLKGNPELLAQAEKLEASIGGIEKGNKATPDAMGLEAAKNGLQSVLKVVESGDRSVPQQAIEVYQLTDGAAKNGIAEWMRLKSGELAEFNRAVQKAGLHPIQVSVIENTVEHMMSR